MSSDYQKVVKVMTDELKKALDDYRAGRMIIVTDDEKRENEADLVFSAQYATQDKLAFMIRHTSGVVCVAVTADRARTLDLPQMVSNNQDLKHTAFTVSVDYKAGLTTGISAKERANTILALSDNKTTANDFVRPGHVFPLVADRALLAGRAGHTEAAVALSALTDQTLVGVLSELVNDDGTMMTGEKVKEFARSNNLQIISIAELTRYFLESKIVIKPDLVEYNWSDLPRENKDWKIATEFGSNGHTHAILSYGEIKPTGMLVRIHSECLTGEAFGSTRCDCKDQLNKAMEEIERAGSGLVIYLRGHEGRGIGLSEKIKAYKLQDEGLDTVEANLALGHSADLRSWEDAALILKNLNISQINLLTNNPEKISALVNKSIEVKQVPIITPKNAKNMRYLDTKRIKLNHIMEEK
jgi:3,4-dihydroxy 2-butanone 4-phosphate synthase/GTP cyclohydrolase II